MECPRENCNFVTEYKHHLEYHLRNHFGSKPFKCEKCNYSCVNKSMLNSHLKSHSNIYQYRCADCAYATKYCHSLKLHLRKYTHKPATVLNLDGTPNPYPIIDVYGTRRGPRPKKKKDDSDTTPGNASSRQMNQTAAGIVAAQAKDLQDQRRQRAPALYAGILMDKEPLESLRRPSTSGLDSGISMSPPGIAGLLAMDKKDSVAKAEQRLKEQIAEAVKNGQHGIDSLLQFPSPPPSSAADTFGPRSLAALANNPLLGMPGLMNGFMPAMSESVAANRAAASFATNPLLPGVGMEALIGGNSPLSSVAPNSLGALSSYPYLPPYAGLLHNQMAQLNAAPPPPPQPQPQPEIPLPKALSLLMPGLVRELITQTALFLSMSQANSTANGSNSAANSSNASPVGDDDERTDGQLDEQLDDEVDDGDDLDRSLATPGALDLSNKQKHI